MKASEIRVGGVYLMRVSGKLVRVRVDDIDEHLGYNSQSLYGPPRRVRARTIYHCINLATGRKCSARSPQKFRAEVKPTPGPQGEPQNTPTV